MCLPLSYNFISLVVFIKKETSCKIILIFNAPFDKERITI